MEELPRCEVCARTIEPSIGNPVAYPDDLRYRLLAFHSVCLMKKSFETDNRWGRMLLWPRWLTEKRKRAVMQLQKYCTRLQVRPGTDARVWENRFQDEIMLRIEDKVYRLFVSQQAETRFLEREAEWERQVREEEDAAVREAAGIVTAIHLLNGDSNQEEQNLENDEEQNDDERQQERTLHDPMEQFEDQNELSAVVEELEGPTYEAGANSHQRSLQPNLPPIYRLLARALDLMEQREGVTQQLARFFRRRDYDNNWLYGLIRRRLLMHQFSCPFTGPDNGNAPICQFPLTRVCPFYYHGRDQDQDLTGEDLRQARPAFPDYICLREALFGGFETKECPNVYFIGTGFLRCLDGYHCSEVKDLERFDLFTAGIFRQLTHSLASQPASNTCCVSCGRSGDLSHSGNPHQDDNDDSFLGTVWVHQQHCLHSFHAPCFLAYALTYGHQRLPCPANECKQYRHRHHDGWSSHCIVWPEASFQSEQEKSEVFDWSTMLCHTNLTDHSLNIEEMETTKPVEIGPRPSPRLFRLVCSNGLSLMLDYTQDGPRHVRLF